MDKKSSGTYAAYVFRTDGRILWTHLTTHEVTWKAHREGSGVDPSLEC